MNNYIILCLAVFATVTQASADATPAQNMVYWHSYRFEVEAYRDQAGSMTIAPGCKGSAVYGRCNFDEFLSYIVSDESNPIEYETNLKEKWDVTSKVGIPELKNIRATQRAKLHRLLPVFPRGEVVGFEFCLVEIHKSINKAEKEIHDSGRDFSNFKWFRDILIASEEVVEVRSREQSEGFLRDFRAWLREQRVGIDVKTQPKLWTFADGRVSTWLEVDWPQTFKNIKSGRMRNLAKQWKTNYNTPVNTGAAGSLGNGQRHAILIESFNQLQFTVNGMCPSPPSLRG